MRVLESDQSYDEFIGQIDLEIIFKTVGEIMLKLKKSFIIFKLSIFLLIGSVAGIDVKSAFASELNIEGQRTALVELDRKPDQARQSKISKHNLESNSSEKESSEVIKKKKKKKKKNRNNAGGIVAGTSFNGGARGWSR